MIVKLLKLKCYGADVMELLLQDVQVEKGDKIRDKINHLKVVIKGEPVKLELNSEIYIIVEDRDED